MKNTYEAKPFYLEEKNFYKIKENIDNLTIIENDFKNMLNQNYDFMNLSDLFEYIDQSEMIELENAVFNSLSKHGRVAFWNMMNIRNFNVHNRINDESDINNDRAFFYRDFLVYEND